MSFTRQSNGNIQVKLSLSWNEIGKEIEKQTKKAISETELPGFRKGKAPRDLVESKLDKSQLLSQSLSELLPQIYTKVIDENKLKPVLYPQVRVNKGKWGEDFEFTATTCESPTVKLPEKFIDDIKKLKIKNTDKPLPDILEYLHKHSLVVIPDLLITEESNHRLAHLAENLTQLGMDISKYLNTKKITMEDLKAQTATAAKSDLEIEFILGTVQTVQKLENRQAVLNYLANLPKPQK